MIFSKKKYHFNPITLTFEEIKFNRRNRVLLFMACFLAAIALTITSGFVLNEIFGSQESRLLENQRSLLRTEMLNQIKKVKQLSMTLQNDVFAKDNNFRMILQLDTLPYSLRNAGTGGSAAANEISRMTDISNRVNEVISSLNNQLKLQSGSFRVLYERAMEYSAEQTHLPAIMPVAQNDLTMISTDFGVRSDPFLFIERTHCGLDFVAPTGKNVYATGDGIVTFVQYSRTGYGNEILIDHRFGFGSRYAHLNAIKVKEGQRVKRGQIIGTVGETGRATGPHLHYEVLFEQRPVNPSFYFDASLTTEEYAQIINKANIDSRVTN